MFQTGTKQMENSKFHTGVSPVIFIQRFIHSYSVICTRVDQKWQKSLTITVEQLMTNDELKVAVGVG